MAHMPGAAAVPAHLDRNKDPADFVALNKSLRACFVCRLVKSYAQVRGRGCHGLGSMQVHHCHACSMARYGMELGEARAHAARCLFKSVAAVQHRVRLVPCSKLHAIMHIYALPLHARSLKTMAVRIAASWTSRVTGAGWRITPRLASLGEVAQYGRRVAGEQQRQGRAERGRVATLSALEGECRWRVGGPC